MKLGLVLYKCSNCTNFFDAPSLSEYAYGEFLLWSKQGNVAYMNAFEDSIYNEVDNLLQSHPRTSNMDSMDRANLLQKIYGRLACDADTDDGVFEIALPPCPVCSNQKIESCEFKTPLEIVDVALKPLGYRNWLLLSESEKLEQLDVVITDITK